MPAVYRAETMIARAVPAISILLLLACLICTQQQSQGDEVKLERFSYRQRHMGTLFQLTLFHGDEIDANRAAKAAFDRIRELDAALSDYQPESELNKLSATSGTERTVSVSDDLWTVLKFAKDLHQSTGGAFDVTVGPMVGVWRTARTTKELPDDSALEKCRTSVGSAFMVLGDEKERTVMLKTGDMRLDLGAIAKGYALDEALRVVREKHGIERALIDGGGDVLAGDPPPGRDHWNVAVRHPKGGDPWIFPLKNGSLATSGDVFQFVEIGGVRYSHIVDPKTGLGLKHRMQVSVIAPTGMEADALASAVSVLGEQKGLAFVRERKHAEAMLVLPDGEEAVRIIRSPGFSEEIPDEAVREN